MVERITSRRSTLRTLPALRGGNSPSASGSEDVLRGARPDRPRIGLRWARSTEADGEGDVREPCDTKSAPPRLTTGLSEMGSFFLLDSAFIRSKSQCAND